jgi:hypothetical protein
MRCGGGAAVLAVVLAVVLAGGLGGEFNGDYVSLSDGTQILSLLGAMVRRGFALPAAGGFGFQRIRVAPADLNSMAPNFPNGPFSSFVRFSLTLRP